MIKIAIIGDSASSGIGAGNEIYPYLLYQSLNKTLNVQIDNFSVPGLTSSDALIFYHSRLRRDCYDYLIIYLGNNEGVYSSSKKPYKNYFSRLVDGLFNKMTKNRTGQAYTYKKLYSFDYHKNNSSVAISPGDFKKNLEFIVSDAKKRKTELILINPIANRYFAGGLGNGNSVFFKLIDYDEKIADLLQPTDECVQVLIDGIGFQEEKRYQEMLECYQKVIASGEGSLSSFVAKNNLIVYRSSQTTEKIEDDFLGLINKFKQYNSIIYFNLYLFLRKIGEVHRAEYYLDLAYKDDFSLYRVKDIYRDIIDDISEGYRLSCLDLNRILNQNDFIDYCHPTPHGHLKIADSLNRLIVKEAGADDAITDAPKGEYKNLFISPNYYTNRGEDIVNYYSIDCCIHENEIRQELMDLSSEFSFNDFKNYEANFEKLIELHKDNPLKCHLINFIVSNMAHPIFTEKLDLLSGALPYSHEIMSFPEFYLYRIIYNYYSFYEKKIRRTDFRKILSASHYKNMILRHNNKPLELELNTSREYLFSIEEKIRHFLEHSRIFENMISFRIRTIIYWYTREAFRYGAQSRHSMLYNRLEIDRLIEAAVVVLVISYLNNMKDNMEKSYSLLENLEELINIHEHYVKLYSDKKDFVSRDYENELVKIKGKCVQNAKNEKDEKGERGLFHKIRL